jgi:transglutaminase-like putative cysteine protease
VTPKRAAPAAVVALLVIGAACVSVRTSLRRPVPLAPGDSTWQLTYDVKLHARKAGASVRVAFPENTPHCRVSRHSIVEREGLTPKSRRPNRRVKNIVLTAPQPGQCGFQAHFNLHLSEQGDPRSEHRDVKLTAAARDKYLHDERDIQVSDPLVTATVERLRKGLTSQEGLLARLFEHCAGMLPAEDDAPQDALSALSRNTAAADGRARAMVALCRAAKVPARLVTGFEIDAGDDVQPCTWLEVYSGSRWEPYDPGSGVKGDMPARFLPVRHGGVQLVRAAGADVTDLEVAYSVVAMPPPSGTIEFSGRNPLQILDLTRLPARLHEPLEIILLLPLGALVTAAFRTIIGLRTFGTFTPTLLALAFVYNDWQTGLIVFATVLVLGLMSRSLLDRLKLLLVPRLGIMLTLVVLCMVFGIRVQHYLGWTPTGEMVLLPMVILTMLVERFYVTTEEDSMRFSLQLLAGTLALGFIVYLLLEWKPIGHMLLVYPELHCFTVAAFILMGRYTGYRLTELWRFRDMAGSKR